MTLVSLSEVESFLLRPVMEGLCKYESLIDGTLDLCDIMKLNDALDVRYENQHRYQEAQKWHKQ